MLAFYFAINIIPFLLKALGTGVGSSLGMAMSRAIMSRITPDTKQGMLYDTQLQDFKFRPSIAIEVPDI